MSALPWIGVFVAAFGWRLWLILDQPVVFAWDAFLRVWERDTLFASHWLPVPQLPLLLSGDSVTAMRAVYAVSGAAGAVAMGAAVARIADRRTGLLFACLLALQPTYVQWTTVPYQEGFLLCFLGLALLAWPRGLTDHRVAHTMKYASLDGAGTHHSASGEVGPTADAHGRAPWLGAAALAVACLCRYEAWGVAAILAAGALLRRRARALRYVAPAAAVVVVWIATAPLRAPRLGAGPFPDPKLLRSDASSLFHSLVDAVPIVGREVVADLTWLALPVAAWGVAVAWRKGGVARELMVALAMLCALAVARQANAGFLTTRMAILPVAFALLAASYGLVDLTDRLGNALSASAAMAVLSGVAAIWLGFAALKGRSDVAYAAHWYAPEAAVARELETLPPDDVVRIDARADPGGRNLSLVTAIFGNSLRLDPRAGRWIYPGKPGPAPTVRVYWNGEAYVIER